MSLRFLVVPPVVVLFLLTGASGCNGLVSSSAVDGGTEPGDSGGGSNGGGNAGGGGGGGGGSSDAAGGYQGSDAGPPTGGGGTATLSVDGEACAVTSLRTDPSGPPCGVNWSTTVSATCPTVGSLQLVIDSNVTIPYPQTCISQDENCNVAGSGWVRASMLIVMTDASFQSYTAADGACTVTTGPTASAPSTPVSSQGTVVIEGVMHTYDLQP